MEKRRVVVSQVLPGIGWIQGRTGLNEIRFIRRAWPREHNVSALGNGDCQALDAERPGRRNHQKHDKNRSLENCLIVTHMGIPLIGRLYCPQKPERRTSVLPPGGNPLRRLTEKAQDGVRLGVALAFVSVCAEKSSGFFPGA